MNKEDSADSGDDEAGGDAIVVDEIEEHTSETLETVEEEQERESVKEVTLIDKLGLLEEDRVPPNPYRKFDQRRHTIYENVKDKFKSAPKTLLQKAEAKKSRIERQLEASDHKLADLLSFGDELVTNIKVANEKRELTRREYESERREELDRDLRKESIESLARFDNIASRWLELNHYREPVALYEQLEEQKERIGELMQSKDDIIDQCQKEIDRINEKYYADQEKQATDVCCLVERIDNQVELIKSAYNSHMELLQHTIEDERLNIKLNASNRWQEFYQIMTENEQRKFEIARAKEEFYGEQIARISAKQEEITRATHIRLEKDAELLEWELRTVKTSVLMNSEKLDYNYQVLQKRNEENVIISNQQKRRVAKQTETISTLKKKIQAANAKAEQSARKFSADITKLHASISELEKKAQQFRRSNKQKFDRVWAMNFKEMRSSLDKIFEIDRILYEQQLVMPWSPPAVNLEDINADAYAAPRPSVDSVHDNKKSPTQAGSPKETPQERADRMRFLRNIIRRIADRGGFLVEEKLFKILEPYNEEEQCVVRIDNIFTALRIKDIKSTQSLIKYFEPYAWCPNCSNGLSASALQNLYTVTSELRAHRRTSARSTLVELQQKALEMRKLKEEQRQSAGDGTAKVCTDHYLVIEPALVLTSLSDFTAHYWARRSIGAMRDTDEEGAAAVNLIGFDNETIETFWRKFLDYIPQDKRKLWDVLQHGLNHYMEVLKQRAQLDTECAFLRRQNQELKHLLQKFKI